MSSTVPSLVKLIEQFEKLPGIGRKSAQRMAFFVLSQPIEKAEEFANALVTAHRAIRRCSVCCNLSEQEICPVCSDPMRDRSTICIVESPRDVMSFERVGEYRGLYHVLGGIISPMDGVGPSDIEVDSLIERVKSGDIHEIILALPTTMEGDTTNFYIYRRLQNTVLQSSEDNINSLKISQIARGVAIGNELEYTDEITLGRSILNRIEFKM